MIRLKPTVLEKYLSQFSELSKRIIEHLDAFSKEFEVNASLCDQLSFILPKLKYGQGGQEGSARQRLQGQLPEVAQLEEALVAARKAALEVALAAPLDEAKFRRLAASAAEIEIELTVLRARAISGISPPLSEGQREGVLRAALP